MHCVRPCWFSTQALCYKGNMENKWNLMVEQARCMAQNTRPVSALCNILSLLYWTDESLNWVGLYFLDEKTLYLGPFVGKPACMEIPEGTGVVGTCAKKKTELLVPDVHAFAGHIACDSDSRSEAVFPLMDGQTVMAVLDIDCLKENGISRPCFEEYSQIAEILSGLLVQMRACETA